MRIFVVDDDPFYAEAISYQLSLEHDYEVVSMESGQECLSNLHQQPHVISADYDMPGMNGGRLMEEIHKRSPHLPVIILSGQQDMATALELLKSGAEDYIIKNDDAIIHLRHTIRKVKERIALQEQVDSLQEEVQKKYEFGKVIKGNSEVVKKVFAQMSKAAKANITVSITGETGTGKELVAKSIHYHSDREKAPFIAVNVAAIPSELIESELFGHEKGAFTGAVEQKKGKFELANKGTLFLDEIGEMDLNMQAKLLRVLQEREVVKVGGYKTIKINFRLIIATHKNLAEEVKKGKFRQDLFFRLLGLSIELPPLRERKEDITVLANHFLKEYAKENKMPIKTISPEARKKLVDYSFPGNIRELRALVELASVLADGESIEPEHITFQEGDILAKMLQGAPDTLKGYTRKIVRHFLDAYNNDYDIVAQKLDIGKSTIYKMKKDGEI